MSKTKLRPFMGIDGEGCGVNRQGQQHYMLLRAGPHELFTGQPLTTLQCLDFICSLPDDPLLVGFSFGYDTTQILRDLSPERLDRLFEDKEMGPGRSRYTYYETFGIEYLPKNYLRVCRLRRKRVRGGPNDEWITHVTRIPDSTRTIYETFGNFQMSFLKALQAFDVGKQHWEMIERMKAGRALFTRITREIREYNRLECDLLAELMEEFRRMCHAAGIRPRTWNGAGKIASDMHDRNGTITAEQLAPLLPAQLIEMARDAYYGGRFEVARTGEIKGPVFGYDINSAYPAAMLELPCLIHGRWKPFVGKPPARSLHVAYAAFSHPAGAPLCGLPIRKQDGRLFWPREGQGTYWSPEINSAKALGATIRYTAGWRYERRCECQPFAWVAQRYEQRRELGKDKRGYPIKLGLNSLYGKLAQRIGNPRWGNLVWAGLVTAITRAKLNDAARQNPASVLMFATDALFSKRRLKLPEGDGLGQWDAKRHERLFVVQPGLYWGAAKPKTRGVPASLFAGHTETFERHWRLWCATMRGLTGPPVVGIPVPLFVPLRLAHARGKPETAGMWIDADDPKAIREFSFDWARKRDGGEVWETPVCVCSGPSAGAPDLVSVPYDPPAGYGAKTASEFDLERAELDDQPDPVDLSPPI